MSTLILLHGALGADMQLFPLQKLLKEHYDVHTINFSGHRGHHFDLKFAIEEFSEDIMWFLVDQGIHQCDIFGYSMGGYAALHCAMENPDRISRIMTLGTKFNWDKKTAANEIQVLDPTVIEEKYPKFAASLALLHGHENWKVVVDKTAKMIKDLGKGAAMTSDDFKNIQQQVLITLGTEDKMVTGEESQHVAGLLPNGSFKWIDGFQHPIDKINMSVLAKEIQSFFV